MKPLFIGGERVTTSHGVDNVNPSDICDIIDVYAQAGRAETETAIGVATDAASAWGLSGPQQRHDILLAAGNEILARKSELGELLACEEGKIPPEAIGEVTRAGHIFLFFYFSQVKLCGSLGMSLPQ